MSDKRIIWKMPDGSIRVTIPIAPPRDGETETKHLNRIATKARPEGAVKKGVIDKTKLPYGSPTNTAVVEDYVLDEKTKTVSKQAVVDKTRCFRGCWRWDGSKVVVDPTLEKAERWKRVRAIRDKLLVDSDGIMARETEQGGANEAACKTYRKSLRDIPQDNADPKNVTWPVKP